MNRRMYWRQELDKTIARLGLNETEVCNAISSDFYCTETYRKISKEDRRYLVNCVHNFTGGRIEKKEMKSNKARLK